jgi:hypothetical protein
VEVVEVRPVIFCLEGSTMLVLGIILSFCGIGVFCWLLFTLAIYALPFFVGLNIAFAAFHSGAGIIGAFIVGIFSGAAALFIGQFVFATVKVPAIRISIALLYAIPAAIAGYSATLHTVNSLARNFCHHRWRLCWLHGPGTACFGKPLGFRARRFGSAGVIAYPSWDQTPVTINVHHGTGLQGLA